MKIIKKHIASLMAFIMMVISFTFTTSSSSLKVYASNIPLIDLDNTYSGITTRNADIIDVHTPNTKVDSNDIVKSNRIFESSIADKASDNSAADEKSSEILSDFHQELLPEYSGGLELQEHDVSAAKDTNPENYERISNSTIPHGRKNGIIVTFKQDKSLIQTDVFIAERIGSHKIGLNADIQPNHINAH